MASRCRALTPGGHGRHSCTRCLRHVGSSVRAFWKPGFASTHTCSSQNRKDRKRGSCRSIGTEFYVISKYSEIIRWSSTPKRLRNLVYQRRSAARVGTVGRWQGAGPKGLHVDTDQDAEPHCAARRSN